MKQHWADADVKRCACQGKGWAMVDVAMWKECPLHFEGQLDPQAREVLSTNPSLLLEAERKSHCQFQIRTAKAHALELEFQLKRERERLIRLERELVNRTPTVRAMAAVKVTPVEITEEDILHEDQ